MESNNGNGSIRNRARSYLDPMDEAMANRMVQNLTSERMEVLRRQTGGQSDPRRSIAAECGFPEGTIGVDLYRNMYERNPIAKRVVEVLPHESWQTQPQVYEDEDPEVSTPFEHAWDDLSRNLRGGSLYQDEEGSPIWEYLHRVDVLSGIGHFGLILLGIDDGKDLQEPVEGSITTNVRYANFETAMSEGERDHLLKQFPNESRLISNIYQRDKAEQERHVVENVVKTASGNDPFGPSPSSQMGTDAQYFGWYGKTEFQAEKPSGKKRELMFLRVFPEYLVQVVRYESNLRNARFGQPVMYRITLNDPRDTHSGVGLPIASIYVHWSRVLHIADTYQGGASSSEIFGVPRQRPVMNNLLSLEKLYGASGEAYWKACVNAMAFNTHPQLGGDVNINMDDMRDQVENFQNSLQRFLTGVGGSWTSIAPTVTDPTPHITMHLEAICICIGCPIRIFKGSERGELASSQDDGAWNDRLKFRQYMYISPKIIVPFIDRLVLLGILPQPKKSAEDVVANWQQKGYVVNKSYGGWLVSESGDMAYTRQLASRKVRGATWNAETAVPSDNLPSKDKSLPNGPNPNASEISKPKPVAFVGGGGYSIQWKDLESNTQLDKANIANIRTTALAAAVAGNVFSVVPEHYYMTEFMEFDDETTKEILDARDKDMEESMDKHGDLADAAEEHDLQPIPPHGFENKPEPPPPMPGMPGGPPTPPVKMGAGESLVHPETGKTVAKTPFPPKPEGTSKRGNPTKNEETRTNLLARVLDDYLENEKDGLIVMVNEGLGKVIVDRMDWYDKSGDRDPATAVGDKAEELFGKESVKYQNEGGLPLKTSDNGWLSLNEAWPVVFNQEELVELTENSFCATGPGGGVDPTCSAADRVDKVYDSNALKTRENADAWNAKFAGKSSKKVETKVAEAVKKTLDEYGETTIPKIHAEVGGDKIELMRAVSAMSKDGRLRLTPDTGSLHSWAKKGGDADLTMVDYGGAPMDIVSLTRNMVENCGGEGSGVPGPCPHLDKLKAISDEHLKGTGGHAEMHAKVDEVLAGLSKEQLKEAAVKFGSRSAKGRKERVEGIKRFISDRREMYQRSVKNQEGTTDAEGDEGTEPQEDTRADEQG